VPQPSAHLVGSVVLAAALLAGCGGQPHVWVADPMRTITTDSPPVADPIVDPMTGVVKLFAAANETVSFQLVLDAQGQSVRGLRLRCDGLRSGSGATIAADNVEILRMWPIAIDRYPAWFIRLTDRPPAPASFYDALTPLDAPQIGQPFDLQPHRRLALWVDVSVPRDARPGVYRGHVELGRLGASGAEVPVELEVYDLVLPDARPIPAIGAFGHRELFESFFTRGGRPYWPQRLDRDNSLVREGLTLLRELMQLAHRHRLDLFDRDIAPQLRRDEAGTLWLDWTDYDAIVGPYLDGTAFADRIGCAAWPIPFHDGWPPPENYGGVDSALYVRTMEALLAQVQDHFAGPLKASAQGFCWPYRHGIAADAYAPTVHLAHIVRAGHVEAPILSQLPPDPPQPTGWTVPKDFDSLIDIYAPPGQWFDPALAARAVSAGHPLRGVWLSPGKPPYAPALGLLATAADVRALPWMAMKYNCTGVFLPEVLHWPVASLTSPVGAETRLFYPLQLGSYRAIVPSVRLKRLRRGLQDIAYLWILRQRGREGVAAALLNAMIHYAGLAAAADNYLDPRLNGWVQDGDLWRLAHRLLAEEANEAVHGIHGTGAPDRSPMAQRLRWDEFAEKAYRLQVERIRTRVEPAGEGNIRAVILMDLYNLYGRDLDAVVRLAAVPLGWEAGAGKVNVSLAPGGRQVVALSASGPPTGGGRYGKVNVPISITLNDGKVQEFDAAVAVIDAPYVRRPPVIDGILTDWPLKAGNTAGAFRLVGRRGQAGDGLAARQTLAFVLHDEQNLYIAVRCEEPSPAGMTTHTSNVFTYEQLLAAGEDLVEIILDPGQKATAPQQLYHIAVKPTGAMVAERGVRTDPPLGPWQPWPAGIQLAVTRQKDFWAVEMAVPLEAFGLAAREKFWSVNFARFASQGAEASSWAEAPRYFYDPRNLGTMILQGPQVP